MGIRSIIFFYNQANMILSEKMLYKPNYDMLLCKNIHGVIQIQTVI